MWFGVTVFPKVFNIRNRTAEGKIASLALWGIYILPLIKKLRDLGLGCHIGNIFVASILFADDIILVSPNRKGAQLMLTTCERSAKENVITFSMDPCLTKSKTKAMWVTGSTKPRVTPVTLRLDRRELPYVDSLTHLRHTLAKDGRMNIDTQIKRMTYISKCKEVKETYSFLHPKEMKKIILMFCSAFYDSNLWDFQS